MRTIRMRFLVPSVDGAAVLLDAAGGLPTIDVDVESTAMSGTAAAARHFGLEPPVLDCFVDQTSEEQLAGAIREALIVMPGSSAAPSSPDLRWAAMDDARPRCAAGLQPVCDARLGELLGRIEPHPLRNAWSEPGWYERAVAWIERSLAEAGRPPPIEVVQQRAWGISAVMRVDAPDRPSWFKASYPPFAHEPAVTELVASVAPGLVPDVIASDHSAGWMLLDDLGPTSADPKADAPTAIERLVALQSALAGRVDEFLGAGCPDRRLEGLPEALAGALERPPVVAAGLAPQRSRRRAMVAAVERAAGTVANSGLPPTIVHGDFHPGNVASVPGRGLVVFDWSDASMSSPAVEPAIWSWWLDDDLEGQERIWELFGSAWSRHFDVDAANLDRHAIEVVAAAFHAISYVGIVDHIEPIRWPEAIEGVERFVTLLDRLTA